MRPLSDLPNFQPLVDETARWIRIDADLRLIGAWSGVIVGVALAGVVAAVAIAIYRRMP